ncbi:DUF1543 domain-containing protein [Aquihabitans sp. G128]|uniref:DUF1543 domain-containing protein n=1 Tax=Aquihabitans sp. G128 TaxID=2849779 RepID=UPI001C214D6A|nr:DUF1543 domain-containing protein [Aquihabitans sp. G128]QXC62225.1 DUF1543 domain-containing protein [Aquihabitans sp. G128]
MDEGTAMDLYAVYLGGDLSPGRIGEDHEVVFVVGDDVRDVRKRGRAKWQGKGRCHVDAIVRIDQVDGHAIAATPSPDGATGDVVDLDPTYEPGD